MDTLSKAILAMNIITIIISLRRASINRLENKKTTFQVVQVIVNIAMAFIVLKSNGYL